MTTPTGPTDEARARVERRTRLLGPAYRLYQRPVDLMQGRGVLERHGDGLAAFIVASVFSSDGVHAHPTSWLAPVAEVVRRAGGLFIADEVQADFGRTGERLWGYQRHGIDPDIVTLGKPRGNGHPVAGVAVAPEVVRRFGADLRERRVLISATGAHANTLKIRPPLVFAERHAARPLTELEAVFAALPP